MTAPGLLRCAAAAAALVLAVASRGDALVLAAALALAAWRPAPAVAVGAALVATSWRWGSSSLEDIAGAQAVLGPAGWVGPTTAAAGAWLGAAALLMATPQLAGRVPRALGAAASGTAAAVVVAGPAPGGDLWVRVVGGVLATAVACAVGSLRARGARARVTLDATAVVAALAALVAVGQEARAWTGTLSVSAAWEGVAVALAAAGVVLAGQLGRAGMEQREG